MQFPWLSPSIAKICPNNDVLASALCREAFEGVARSHAQSNRQALFKSVRREIAETYSRMHVQWNRADGIRDASGSPSSGGIRSNGLIDY